MYQPIQSGRKGLFVFIIILAGVFIAIYDNYVFAAEKQFKSEEDTLNETRSNIEKYLNDQVTPKAKVKPIVIEEQQEEPIQAESTAPPPVKEGLPADVTPITLPDIKQGKGANKQPAAKEVGSGAKPKGPFITQGVEEPVLKKMDISRIGATPYYETYEGLRLLKYFTVAQRVEIYQEPRPIDAYILDAYSMRYLYHNTPWNVNSDYRSQIVPIFTRAYGTEITFNDPKNKEAQIRYTHDYRNIYRNYHPKYNYNDLQGNASGIKEEMWDQNEILFMHAKEIEPLGWLYTSNLGYRYSTMNCKSDPVQTAPNYSYYEVRHTYLGSLVLAPSPKLEYFFQGEYYKSMHVKCPWSYRPDHFMGRTEVRIKSNDMKTNFVPQFSFSKDRYYPGPNTYEKYEIAFRVGRNWTKKFSTTHTLQYVGSFRDEPDNQAPTYDRYNPHKDKAEYIAFENRFQYNIYDRLYVQAGLDINNGINWSIFDNWGLLAGLEYYAPGMIRVDVGWRGNHYYNLNDYLSSVYFKFYLFM